MPFSRQIRSKSTSTGGWLNRPVNTLPLSVRTARAPVGAQRRRQPVTDRPGPLGRISRALTQNREWSSMPVNALAWLPSASRNPPTTSICHSSIGAAALPPFEPLLRRCRRTGSITPARTNTGRPPTPTALPADTAAAARARTGSAAAPNTVLTPQLEHHAPRPRQHLMRTRPRPMRPVTQTLQAVGLVSASQACSVCRDTPTFSATCLPSEPVGDHRQHRLIALLSHRKLPHARECQGSAEIGVKHQPKHCQASPEDDLSSISRSNTCPLVPPAVSEFRHRSQLSRDIVHT